MVDEKDKNHLTVVSSNSKETKNSLSELLDPKAIENLDLDELRDTMVKGIFTLEAALFSQAQFEYDRVGKLRDLIQQTEKELFSDDALKKLTPKEKIALYSTVLSNMKFSMDFLQNLHKNVAGGIDAVNQIEKLKKPKELDKPTDASPAVEQVKALIHKTLVEKVKNG